MPKKEMPEMEKEVMDTEDEGMEEKEMSAGGKYDDSKRPKAEEVEIEKADCCATCMSYKPGRMDSGMCGRNMVETKDCNICGSYTAEA